MGQGNSSARNHDKKIDDSKILQLYYINKKYKTTKKIKIDDNKIFEILKTLKKDDKDILKLAKKFGGKLGDNGYNYRTGRRDLDVIFTDKLKAKKFKLELKKKYPKVKYY